MGGIKSSKFELTILAFEACTLLQVHGHKLAAVAPF